jgi:hypothetical protein
MKSKLRITSARRRAVLVVAGTRSRSSSAAVLMASLPRTAASTFVRQGSSLCAFDSAQACANFPRTLIMTSESDLRSLRGADPLRVFVTIALIELSKVVAKPLHIFAIADFMSAVQKAASTP